MLNALTVDGFEITHSLGEDIQAKLDSILVAASLSNVNVSYRHDNKSKIIIILFNGGAIEMTFSYNQDQLLNSVWIDNPIQEIEHLSDEPDEQLDIKKLTRDNFLLLLHALNCEL